MYDSRSQSTRQAQQGEGPPDLSSIKSRVTPLWQPGDLFHNAQRYAQRPDGPPIDRLALILERGLVAPAACDDGTVRSDLKIVVTGAPLAYDNLVFLHRFDRHSGLYLLSQPDFFTVLVESSVRVVTPASLGPSWPVLSADEVYVETRVEPRYLRGLIIHPQDREGVLKSFQLRLHELAIPLYRLDGAVLWP